MRVKQQNCVYVANKEQRMKLTQKKNKTSRERNEWKWAGNRMNIEQCTRTATEKKHTKRSMCHAYAWLHNATMLKIDVNVHSINCICKTEKYVYVYVWGWDFGGKSFSKFSNANEATSSKINAVKRTRNKDIIRENIHILPYFTACTRSRGEGERVRENTIHTKSVSLKKCVQFFKRVITQCNRNIRWFELCHEPIVVISLYIDRYTYVCVYL